MDQQGSLKRVLDFKLVYDCLAEPKSGLVHLDVLLSSWPSLNTLPRDLQRFWRHHSSSEGFLDWDGFSGGLEKALAAADEQLRIGRAASSTFKQDSVPRPTTRKPLALVTAGEIERFLSSCQPDSLVKALAKAGRDVHRWQVSIHKQGSVSEGKKDDSAAKSRKQTNEAILHTSLSTGREREELMKGKEVLEKTQAWFESRLAVLSMEQQAQPGKQLLQAEDLLAELEDGGKDDKTLHHIQEINTHLSSLVLTAKPPTALKKPSSSSTARAEPSAVVEYPSFRGRPRKLPPTPSRARHESNDQGLRHSVSLPASSPTQPASTLPPNNSCRPFIPRRLPHRSSSFNDRNKDGLRNGPVRTATSMTALTQQVTDYPGHHPSPHFQRPIHHSSSVHSLPTHHHPPSSTGPPLFFRPPSRTHSAHSLTSHTRIVSEVL